MFASSHAVTASTELGNLRVILIVANQDGPVEVTVQSEGKGQAQLLMDIEKSEPYRVRRMGVQVGGDQEALF